MVRRIPYFLLVMAMLSACSHAQPDKNIPTLSALKGTNHQHSYEFAQWTNGKDATPLRDGGFLIIGTLLDEIGKNKRDSMVFDLSRGFILNVDEHLEERWMRTYELDKNMEFGSITPINDSLFACLGNDYGLRVLRFFTIDEKGNIGNEKRIDVPGSYEHHAALKCADGKIISTGGVFVLQEDKLDYYTLIHKLNVDGSVLMEREIRNHDGIMDRSCIVSTADGNLLFATSDISNGMIRLIKMDCRLKTIWDQEISGGMNPNLIATPNGFYLLSFFNFQGNHGSTTMMLVGENGNIVWQRTISRTMSAAPKIALPGGFWAVGNTRTPGARLTRLSARGTDQWNRDFEIDSLYRISWIEPAANETIFMMGLQTSGQGPYDRKMVLLNVDAKQE